MRGYFIFSLLNKTKHKLFLEVKKLRQKPDYVIKSTVYIKTYTEASALNMNSSVANFKY